MWFMQSVGLALAGALLLGFYGWLMRRRVPRVA
jgi:LPXTG-motif cell wall-anchored protein